jgi:rhamnosyltransferase
VDGVGYGVYRQLVFVAGFKDIVVDDSGSAERFWGDLDICHEPCTIDYFLSVVNLKIMISSTEKTVCVVILTCQAELHLQKIIPLLISSSLKPSILIVDSSSTDNTLKVADRFGVSTLLISRNEFNHGATREKARKHLNSDIVVMMTQDAYPVNNTMLEHLVRPLLQGEASASYARQIPHEGADIFEAFPRFFNYPPISHSRDIGDLKKYGVFTFFCSDSCAAYLNSALDEIGGITPILTHEDYFAVARLLQKGHRIAYVADAVVSHSHRYSLLQEFKRYFDAGYVRAENPWVKEIAGNAESRGKELFIAFLKEVAKKRPLLIPYVFLNTFVKLLGFRVGYYSLNAPLWFKKMLSSQEYYWISSYYRENYLNRH